MIHLEQTLNTADDSFIYTVKGEDTPRYIVNADGRLFAAGKCLGRFRLLEQAWLLELGHTLFMGGPSNGLFKLPEFELKALTALVNQEQPSAL